MDLTRRAFGFGLLGTAALVVAGGVPLAWRAIDEDRVILAAVEALFPPLDGLPTGVEVDVPGAVRAYLAHMPADIRLQARGLLRLVEVGPLVSHGAAFSALPVADRAAFLDDLAGSSRYPQRLIAHSLKQMCAMGYWQHAATWAHLGYDGPLVGR